MKEEVLDLYDNKFNKLNKTIVRRKDEIPECANIMQSYILIKNNNKYLLEQSNAQSNYHWSIPGGHLMAGETPESGLNRELKEELNIENISYKKIDTIKFPYNKFIFNIFYSEDTINMNDLKFQQEEVIQVEWYTKDEILKLIEEEKIPKGYAFILKKYAQ